MTHKKIKFDMKKTLRSCDYNRMIVFFFKFWASDRFISRRQCRKISASNRDEATFAYLRRSLNSVRGSETSCFKFQTTKSANSFETFIKLSLKVKGDSPCVVFIKLNSCLVQSKRFA